MKFCYEADDLREIAKLMDSVTSAEIGDLTLTGEGYTIERRFTHNVDLKGTDAWSTSITFHDEEEPDE